MKYAVYGLGVYLSNALQNDPYIVRNAALLCDKDKLKWGWVIDGRSVISPKELAGRKCEFDEILVFSTLYFEEISKELVDLGFDKKRIRLYEIDREKPHARYAILNCHQRLYKDRYEPLREDMLATARVLPSRESALKYLPKNGICCEIGVAFGGFSESILREMLPKKFFAIDYFSQNDPFVEFWGRTDFKDSNMPHRKWYENRFRDRIASGLVETRQGFSWDVLSGFPDGFFDYAYLDAAHDYDSVMKDLGVLPHKIKDGGFIQFNDYTGGGVLDDNFYGVIPAVNKFINTSKEFSAQIKFLCLEPMGYVDMVIRIFRKQNKT
jgi:hypothetical protein